MPNYEVKNILASVGCAEMPTCFDVETGVFENFANAGTLAIGL